MRANVRVSRSDGIAAEQTRSSSREDPLSRKRTRCTSGREGLLIYVADATFYALLNAASAKDRVPPRVTSLISVADPRVDIRTILSTIPRRVGIRNSG